MSDPFLALRSPVVPVDPEPTFAARLRTRVARAVALPKGITVSDLLELEREAAATPAPRLAPTGVIPYLAVADARAALEWYVETLGARRRDEPILMPDGRIGHAELELSGGVLYLADESPENNHRAPRPGDGATVSLTAAVDDVDGTVIRAVGAGATLERPPADNPYGRNAVIRDPYGHRWILSAQSAAIESIRQGDIGYVSLWVPDVDRAATFFASVLGWTYRPGVTAGARQVDNPRFSHGLHGGHDRSNLFLCFAVDDIDAAIERVRAAGGTADEPTSEAYGSIANCIDDQGSPFAVYQPPAGAAEPRPAENGAREGDLGYVTLEVRDSSRFREFYRTVLGWRFSPGRVDDGWTPEGVAPMSGMHGGHDRATTVPMYRVDDIGAAIDRVRAAGGAAPEPDRQPYGLSAECTDDQGTRFYLWQP